MSSVIMLVVLALCITIPSAANNTGWEQQFEQAKNLYYQGTYGSKTAADESEKLFLDLYKKAPDDPRVKAYYGSERLLEAAHTWALWKKYSLSKQGMQLLDTAVAKAPDNLEVRFVRAVTTYNLPGFFGRREQALQDFAYLSTRVADAADKGRLDATIAASALLFYGRICKEQSNTSQASEAWKRAERIAPQSKAGRDSASELQKLRG